MEKEDKKDEKGGLQEKKSSSDSKGKNMIAILSYFGILLIIPFLVAKDDEFVKYHVKQGLVLLIAELALMVLAVIPVLGWIVGFFGWIFAIILAIIGIINVVGGKQKELPVIGQYANRFKI